MIRPVVETLPVGADRLHDRWIRLEVLFHAAVRLPTSRRASFLRAASEGDPILAHDVEELLHAHDAAHRRLLRIVAGALAAYARHNRDERG